jgi:hypothetical protein
MASSSSKSHSSSKSSHKRYGTKAQKKISRVMHEYKEGDLKSGSGRKVKSRKQAIAIGISEARHEGDKVPSRKSSSSSSSRSHRKSSAHKSTAHHRSKSHKTSSHHKSSSSSHKKS